MDDKWMQDLDLLTTFGCLGFFSHAKVTQIVLIDGESGKAWNYFTDIYFSSKVEPKKNAEFLTSKLKQVNKKYKLAITTYTVPVEVFRKLFVGAVETQTWGYTDASIDSVTMLDHVYPTMKKYVPCNDPTGGQYQLVVPLEKSLYGSNFLGNYYILELFSTKESINHFIAETDIAKIQSIMKECHLIYDLAQLTDRIGNIVCKFDVELIETKPLALGQRGIQYQFSLSERLENNKEFTIHILQEHDHLIYTNENNIVTLVPGEVKEYGVAPNQLKNTITITDNQTGLIVFMTINDYSVYSNYYSQISPPNFLSKGSIRFRTFKVNGTEQKVHLKDVSGIGDIYFWREMNEAGKRQQKWMDSFFESQNYFKTYTKASHETAIKDIRNILNNQIFWDLEEIWLIDPYLTPNDILETVLFCNKPNIKIKCLTDFSFILGNQQTREMLVGDEEEGNRFSSAKARCQKELNDAIPVDTDVSLSFRTIANGYGTSFHDRYLILKYNVNKTRVWSLGISVNSLGKKHHIIQIVEAPELIADMFQEIWTETNQDVCKIYETHSQE